VGRSGRTAKGTATRSRIVEVATRRFVQDGYVATTIASIARDAGVSPQAVYLAFGSKASILKAANDVAVVGDHEQLALSQRPWMEELHALPDASRALDLVLDVVTALTDRASAIYDVIQAASADPEVAKLLADLTQERRANWLELAILIAAKDGFDQDLSPQRAADILYTLAGPDVLRGVVTDSGWTPQEWRDFVRTTARSQILSPDSHA
jgi:AcrR family transcriptional regulator